MIEFKNFRRNFRSAYPGEYTPSSQFLEYFSGHTVQPDSGEPGLEIFEDNHYFRIEMTVPGLKRENLLVRISEKGNLIIKGMVQHRALDASSLQYATFRREIALPQNIDTDFVKAEFTDSILSLCFLKTTENSPRRESIVAVY